MASSSAKPQYGSIAKKWLQIFKATSGVMV